ncbi:MAG: alpha/beta hydrolase [Deltaproteobacteria bacterium]|nr:alpha/beta hydrolase [Deltaproteobacteria bacterium]
MFRKIILGVSISVLIAVAIYFVAAAVFIISGKPKKPTSEQRGLVFKELYIDYKSIPQLKTFAARDGKPLAYRHYPAQSDKAIILLHGSGWHSRYFFPLAEFISSEGLAQVYTPDLRGHGPAPERRGDVDYIGQLEDDLADFSAMIRKENPKALLIVGGHSSGGGLAIRFAGSKYGRQADAYLLLSPYLQYNAPTVRPDSGGWAQPYTGRIIGLTMLNRVGIRWFNDLAVIDFSMPKEARDGTETLTYTYRLNSSYAPDDYQKDLSAIKAPLFVVVGSADEAFVADQFEPVFSRLTKGRVMVLPDVTHLGLVVGPKVRPAIKAWLEGLGKP